MLERQWQRCIFGNGAAVGGESSLCVDAPAESSAELHPMSSMSWTVSIYLTCSLIRTLCQFPNQVRKPNPSGNSLLHAFDPVDSNVLPILRPISLHNSLPSRPLLCRPCSTPGLYLLIALLFTLVRSKFRFSCLRFLRSEALVAEAPLIAMNPPYRGRLQWRLSPGCHH